MGIGEPHPLARETIEVGRGDFGPIVVAAHVAVAKVIGEDEDDVGLSDCVGSVQRAAKHRPGEQEFEGVHNFSFAVLW